MFWTPAFQAFVRLLRESKRETQWEQKASKPLNEYFPEFDERSQPGFRTGAARSPASPGGPGGTLGLFHGECGPLVVGFQEKRSCDRLKDFGSIPTL